jgi:hypothetical protein
MTNYQHLEKIRGIWLEALTDLKLVLPSTGQPPKNTVPWAISHDGVLAVLCEGPEQVHVLSHHSKEIAASLNERLKKLSLVKRLDINVATPIEARLIYTLSEWMHQISVLSDEVHDLRSRLPE